MKIAKVKAVGKSVVQMIVVIPFMAIMFVSLPFSFSEQVCAWCARVIKRIDGKIDGGR